jgi:predicted RNA-binding Zn ribbon-like protein
VLDIAGVLGRFSRNPVACLLRATLAGNVTLSRGPRQAGDFFRANAIVSLGGRAAGSGLTRRRL